MNVVARAHVPVERHAVHAKEEGGLSRRLERQAVQTKIERGPAASIRLDLRRMERWAIHRSAVKAAAAGAAKGTLTGLEKGGEA